MNTIVNAEAPDFKSLFEAAPGLYLILNPELFIIGASDAYLQATLVQRSDILGRFLFDVFPDNPDDVSATGVSNLSASLKRVLEKALPDVMAIQKYDIKRPIELGGGFEERHWSPVNSPVVDSSGKIKYIIHQVEDVTELVRLKQERIRQALATDELQQQKEHLEKIRHSQRMEAMGQLAGGIASDFNSILSGILTTCQKTLEEPALTPSVHESLIHIQKAGEKASTLTRQLLAFSRKQVLSPKIININSVVTEMQELLEKLLEENFELKTTLATDLGSTLIDPAHVEQIILNLVVNARDAMPHGGKISISTSNALIDRSMLTGNMRVEPGEYIILAVEDNGIGMDAKTQARIFEPFFTTKSLGKGTGLGLATIYGIVSQNKGTIWVYSEPQKGSVFKVYLPMATAAPAQKDNNSTAVSAKELEPSTKTILVVEDDPDLRETVCFILEDRGYVVHPAENGVKALEFLAHSHRLIDLIVSDVMMPEMNGPTMAKNLITLGYNIKLLFLSGGTEDMLTTADIQDSHPEFLAKPFRIEVLLNKIHSVLLK